MFRAVAVWLMLCGVCQGLTITYDGYISRVSERAGNGIAVGDPARVVVIVSDYDTEPTTGRIASSLMASYPAKIEDAYGKVWQDGNLILDWRMSHGRFNSYRLVVYGENLWWEPDTDFFAIEGGIIQTGFAYGQDGSEFIAGSVVYPYVYQDADWIVGNKVTDIPSGRLTQTPDKIFRTGQHFIYNYMTVTNLTLEFDNLSPGDANADGVFNQLDIVQVLSAGRYLNGDRVSWSQGDWNADGLFDQRDIIAAQRRTYAAGRMAAIGVPEPPEWVLFCIGIAILLAYYGIVSRID